MVDNTIFISVKDIMKTLSVSESKAYSVMRELNKELTEQYESLKNVIKRLSHKIDILGQGSVF